MLRLIQNCLVVAAALLSGAPLALLQVAAWTGMLVSNVWQHDMPEAVSRTFDGEHPCALCAFVEGAEESSSGDQGVPVAKARGFDLAATELERIRMPVPQVARATIHDPSRSAPSAGPRPLLEPPRSGSC